MEDRHCDMCGYYSQEDDSELGWCGRYMEQHLPTDGEGCAGWQYWEEAENDTR